MTERIYSFPDRVYRDEQGEVRRLRKQDVIDVRNNWNRVLDTHTWSHKQRCLIEQFVHDLDFLIRGGRLNGKNPST